MSAVQGFDGPGRVSPASVDRDGNINLIDAAAGVGADVVLVSTIGAGPDSPMELFRAKYEAEQHLKASSVRWTIVRASAFAELWADIMVKPIVFGNGDNPINFVSVADVAAVVERAVLDPASRGHTLEVGGPDDLTFNELAGILGTRQRRRRQGAPRPPVGAEGHGSDLTAIPSRPHDGHGRYALRRSSVPCRSRRCPDV